MIKNNVLFGINDWLFLYNGGQNQFDYLQGKKIVEDESVNNFVTNIQLRSKYCEEKNINFCHIVFPSKPVVKKRYLPDHYDNIHSLYQKYYKSHIGNNKNIFYPLEELMKLESSYSTFFKYNTHNSDHGYFEIVRNVLKRIDRDVDFDDYIDCLEEKNVAGDLAKMASLNAVNKEIFIKFKPGFNIYRTGNRDFIQGNSNDVVVLHNINSLTQKRLLAFGDSFLKGALEFLKFYFKEILYVRSSFFHKDMIENYSPDVVFTSNAERYLCNVESPLCQPCCPVGDIA
tara:strand:- start:2 stop:859 length:858 start_codon:yes stop_codon:yes gene_type:complete